MQWIREEEEREEEERKKQAEAAAAAASRPPAPQPYVEDEMEEIEVQAVVDERDASVTEEEHHDEDQVLQDKETEKMEIVEPAANVESRKEEPEKEGPPAATMPATAPSTGKLSVEAQAKAAALERNGLCVVCQDEEANIAIVDCG